MPRVRCKVSVSPVRRIPDHSGEMVTQLIYGEQAIVTDKKAGGWIKIKAAFDGYEGWVTSIQFMEIDDDQRAACLFPMGGYLREATIARWLPPGAELESIELAQAEGAPKEIFADPAIGISQVLPLWMKSPYLWGGRTPSGVDCSGFTQMVYKSIGIALPRDAAQQAVTGTNVDFLQQAQKGDLAFFDNEEGRIYHVGLLLNDQEIMHAYGEVRVDTIDAEGILHRESGQRTHRLRIIKRYF